MKQALHLNNISIVPLEPSSKYKNLIKNIAFLNPLALYKVAYLK